MLEEVKKHYVWKETMALSQALIELCEEFTDDKNVVVWHLRQSVIDIPASVAVDLHRGGDITIEPFVRCAAQLELVRKIYPATDTDPADDELKKISRRINEGTFFDSVGGVHRPGRQMDSVSNSITVHEEN